MKCTGTQALEVLMADPPQKTVVVYFVDEENGLNCFQFIDFVFHLLYLCMRFKLSCRVQHPPFTVVTLHGTWASILLIE